MWMTPKPTDLRKGIEALASGWRQSWAQPMPGDTSLYFNRAGLDQNFEDKVDLPVSGASSRSADGAPWALKEHLAMVPGSQGCANWSPRPPGLPYGWGLNGSADLWRMIFGLPFTNLKTNVLSTVVFCPPRLVRCTLPM